MNGTGAVNHSLVEHADALRTAAMEEARPYSTHRHESLSRAVMRELFGPPGVRPFAVRYWTGETEHGMTAGREPFTLVLHHAAALRRMFLPPSELALGEAFVRGDVSVEGNVEAAAVLGGAVAERLGSARRLARIAGLLVRLPRAKPAVAAGKGTGASQRRSLLGRRHTWRRDAAAIEHHYDVGNEFYSLWLDPDFVYSCGYFADGGDDLDDAQRHKLDLVCRKLRLRPGESLLDIGCGWGGLIRHAVRNYGVEAHGITLSHAEAAFARERITADGFSDRCRVDVADYRSLPPAAAYDKVASVGMFEHVGAAQLPTYFAAAHRLTRPGGLFLNHGIVTLERAVPRTLAKRVARLAWRGGRFMDRYVFPDGSLSTLRQAVAAAEAAGFETRDAESLREHYARTLRHWVARLEEQSSKAVALVGAERYRIWRLYMAASARAFATARIGVVQLLFSRATPDGCCNLPPTRADLYVPG